MCSWAFVLVVVSLLPQIKAHISSYGLENSPASKPTAANHGSAGSAANATSASAPTRRSIFEVKQGITWIHSLPDSALNVKLGCRLPPPATLATCPATPPKSESSQLLGDALARLQDTRWRHHGRIHRHHAHQHESPKCQKSITITDLDSIARHPAGEKIQAPPDFPKQHTTAIGSEPSAIETGGHLALEMGRIINFRLCTLCIHGLLSSWWCNILFLYTICRKSKLIFYFW